MHAIVLDALGRHEQVCFEYILIQNCCYLQLRWRRCCDTRVLNLETSNDLVFEALIPCWCAPAQSDNVYREAFDTMKEWPAEWRTMPERVFGSTLAWLRLRRLGGHDASGTARKQASSKAAMEGGVEAGEHEAILANGGWGSAAVEMRQYELDRCDIARRSASEMTLAEFRRDFADMNRPVLITGAMEGWPAWEHWTKEGLLRKYGAQSVQVRRSSAIATDAEFGGKFRIQYLPRRLNLRCNLGVTGQHAQNMTVADFVRRHMSTHPDKCAGGTSSTCEERDLKHEGEDPEYAAHQLTQAAA